MLSFIMLVVFCLIKGRRCRKHIRSITLTQELADTAPEARYHLWKAGRKLKKSRTLFTSRTYAFPGLPHRSFVRSHLSKVTPSRTWFFDAGVHRLGYRLSYTCQNTTQSISYRPSRYPEFTYRKSVVRAFGSFSEQRLSPSWW